MYCCLHCFLVTADAVHTVTIIFKKHDSQEKSVLALSCYSNKMCCSLLLVVRAQAV